MISEDNIEKGSVSFLSHFVRDAMNQMFQDYVNSVRFNSARKRVILTGKPLAAHFRKTMSIIALPHISVNTFKIIRRILCNITNTNGRAWLFRPGVFCTRIRHFCCISSIFLFRHKTGIRDFRHWCCFPVPMTTVCAVFRFLV